MDTLRFGRYTFDISNADKILFPETEITKGQLIEYYKQIGQRMVRYTKNRPISMVRCPDGIKNECWYQKDAGSYFPEWIKTYPIKKQSGGVTNYVLINNVATLVYLANQAMIAPHIWLSRVDKLNYPDRMIFDLDPSGSDFSDVCTGAHIFKDLCDALGLPAYVMTTGSRGLHIIIPLGRVYTFDYVRDFAYRVAQILVKQHKKLFTLEMRKDKRGKRIFIDVLRNAFGQTGVAPYAVRPKKGAPIAVPIFWNEVGACTFKPNMYTIKNIFKRLDSVDDPWKNINKRSVNLKHAIKSLEKL